MPYIQTVDDDASNVSSQLARNVISTRKSAENLFLRGGFKAYKYFLEKENVPNAPLKLIPYFD